MDSGYGSKLFEHKFFYVDPAPGYENTDPVPHPFIFNFASKLSKTPEPDSYLCFKISKKSLISKNS